MSSNHLIFCRSLLLPPSIFPSIRIFSHESVLCIWLNDLKPQHSSTWQGRISTMPLLPEEPTDWCLTLGTLIQRTYTKKTSPKSSVSVHQWSWCLRVPKCDRKLRLLPKGLACGVTCSKTQQNCNRLKNFKIICEVKTFENLKSRAGGAGDAGDTPRAWRHWQTLAALPAEAAGTGRWARMGKQSQHWPEALLQPEISSGCSTTCFLAVTGTNSPAFSCSLANVWVWAAATLLSLWLRLASQTSDQNTSPVFLWKRPICLSWSFTLKDKLQVTTHLKDKVCVCTQSCPTLCDPHGLYNLPGSSVHGYRARILEWVAISSSMESSWPTDLTFISCISCIGRRVLYRHQPCHLGSPAHIHTQDKEALSGNVSKGTPSLCLRHRLRKKNQSPDQISQVYHSFATFFPHTN